ncbi:hypothetical protein RHMOL_Rhmol05G0289600 [Rhododendron molle]|uniref:Uncharacterized protein n=1 Tax=Rhododendron molle TaxID=49168 RepID=A0ACC0NUC7_RHOML|nr:hypothetical protein RHMOL_Rhmol05G0289600 [Rhododendron molle]
MEDSEADDGFSGPIDFPFLTDSYCPYFKWDPTRTAGICNGLVCIYISRFGYPLIICNPSTRKFREVPRNWLDENGSKGCISVERVSFGFGFHPSANDYKLIRIAVYYRHPVSQYQVWVDLYAMGTDTWTEIDVDKLSSF